MFQFNKVICLIAVLAIFIFLPFTTNATSAIDKAKAGLNQSGSIGFDGTASTDGPSTVAKDLPTAIGQIVGAVLAFIGVLFLSLMIYGGFTWMTARGNDQDVEKAKDLIQAAVVGLVIVLAAYAITSYIGTALSSVPSQPLTTNPAAAN